MSRNKNKYFEVVTTQIVKADNKTMARKAATNRRRVAGTSVIAQGTLVQQRYAREAQAIAEEYSS